MDATAEMYGGQRTTMSMLVSSSHPAMAGVQVALVETLLDFGASLEYQSPLMTALASGQGAAAEALVRRGARVDNIAVAAGLRRLKDASQLLTADAESRHRALALAAQHGHLEVVRLLLDAGEDPNRYNPAGNHAHSTPLHQAVLAGTLRLCAYWWSGERDWTSKMRSIKVRRWAGRRTRDKLRLRSTFGQPRSRNARFPLSLDFLSHS